MSGQFILHDLLSEWSHSLKHGPRDFSLLKGDSLCNCQEGDEGIFGDQKARLTFLPLGPCLALLILILSCVTSFCFLLVQLLEVFLAVNLHKTYIVTKLIFQGTN